MTITDIIKFITDNFTVIITILTPVVGTIIGFFKWLHIVYSDIRALKIIKNKELIEIEEIKKELKSNGGSSIKDAINRIETKINSIEFCS